MSKFNFFTNKGTQKLYRKQFRKVIKRYGIPCYYIKKSESGSLDKLYGEDHAMCFKEAFNLKLYLETFEFYDGTHQSFNSFLSVLDDSLRFKVDIESFTEATKMIHPEEGDLIAIGLSPALEIVDPNNKAYEIFDIKGVNKRSDFYAFGTFFSHVLECSRFEYNHQLFATGIAGIDSLNEIDNDPEIAKQTGDNDYIDELNINGIEAFNPSTGKVEESNKPVVEENPCNPFEVIKNETSEVPWDPTNPYGED